MTTCDSLIMNIMSEPYAGKPHVRFDEEGGNPTLTLRYVDGMGLYNGYFAPRGMDKWGLEVTQMVDDGVDDLSNTNPSDYTVRQMEVYIANKKPSGVVDFITFQEAIGVKCEDGLLRVSGSNSIKIFLFSNYTYNNFTVLDHESLHKRTTIGSWNDLASSLNVLEVVQNQLKCCCDEALQYATSLVLYYQYRDYRLNAQVHTALYGDGGVQSISKDKAYYQTFVDTVDLFEMLEGIYESARDEMYDNFLECIEETGE